MGTYSAWMMSAVEKLGGRKLVLGLAVALIGGVCELVFPGGLSSNMMTLLLGAMGTFTVGNMAEHYAKRPGIQYNAVMNDSEYGVDKIEVPDPLEVKVDGLIEAVNTSNQALGFLVQYVKAAQAANQG